MGDRGNIVIREEGGGRLYLYSHWAGSGTHERLQAALKRGRERWSDEPYLARVIFQSLLGDEDGVTGYGLSTRPQDNEHHVLHVFPSEVGRVELHDRRTYGEPEAAPLATWTFEEFASLDLPGDVDDLAAPAPRSES